MLLKDRASYLAGNFMLKTLAYGRKDLKDKIDWLKERLRGFIGNRMEVIAETWEKTKNEEKMIGCDDNFELFQRDYWAITSGILIEVDEGKIWEKEGGREEEALLECIKLKYDMGV